VREGAAGGGTAVVAESIIGVGGSGVNVCVAVAVAVGVSVAGGACVNVGSGVSTCPDGWKGVGVGDAFGSCVININVGKTCGVVVGEAQEVSKVKSKK
jgi:hypothetical protein